MKIFIAASYASKVDYETGKVFENYKDWLEDIIKEIESLGHSVFSALKADQYKINSENPAEAFNLDIKHINESDCLIALVEADASTGVQTEIGIAIALNKKVIIAHKPEDKLAYFNLAIIKAGKAYELYLPFGKEQLSNLLRK